MEQTYLTYEDVYAIISDLAKSQGMYGRYKHQIDHLPSEDLERFKQSITEHKFKDAVDLILYIEG